MRRRWIVGASAIVLGCGVLAGSNSAASAAGSQPLASSSAIERQVDAATRYRTLQGLAALRFEPSATLVSPEELDTRLGHNLQDPDSRAEPLDEIEIAARAPPGVREQPLQSQTPLGLAGIAWGFQHPGEAWRLLLPVLVEQNPPHGGSAE